MAFPKRYSNRKPADPPREPPPPGPDDDWDERYDRLKARDDLDFAVADFLDRWRE